MKSLFSAETWIAWIVATATAALTLASYVHATFKTLKQDDIDRAQSALLFDRTLNQIDRRLERIENRLDDIRKK